MHEFQKPVLGRHDPESWEHILTTGCELPKDRAASSWGRRQIKLCAKRINVNHFNLSPTDVVESLLCSTSRVPREQQAMKTKLALKVVVSMDSKSTDDPI